ncbi:MAG: DMT family transporter [Ruminococcaceae bacterium]|nr:DMT family transporter [Oscillospiraceae bacterium]
MKNKIYYIMLAIVYITWGLDPIINRYFYNYFSASALVLLATLASFILFLALSFKKLRLIDKRYLKIAVPICIISSLANILQRIGLQYTTPASYAFLEQLACVVVPILLFILARRKPTLLQSAASIFCLVGCFIFSGLATSGGIGFGIGDILCALAGIFGGIALAATGLYVKELDIRLYTLIHMSTYFMTSLIMAISLNLITSNGAPIEKLTFTAKPAVIIGALVFGLFSVGICWLMRNKAVSKINPALVAIIGPSSAIITGIVSLILKIDKISPHFIIGSALILIAMVLSAANDIRQGKKQKNNC